MGRVLKIELTSEQQAELEIGYKNGKSHAFRQRCRMILLKSAGYKTKEICNIVDIKSQQMVNKWILRYKSKYKLMGISVLHNAEGQGRKPIFDAKTETEKIQEVVRGERQKLENAKLILEKDLNKSFNIKTLKNFLKALAGDTKE